MHSMYLGCKLLLFTSVMDCVQFIPFSKCIVLKTPDRPGWKYCPEGTLSLDSPVYINSYAAYAMASFNTYLYGNTGYSNFNC